MMMGSYASEKQIFKDISTGVDNDLKEASELARKLFTKYGMSRLGTITFGKTEELIFIGREIAVEKNYSEKVAAKIDEEIQKILKLVYEAAVEILSENGAVFKKIAARR